MDIVTARRSEMIEDPTEIVQRLEIASGRAAGDRWARTHATNAELRRLAYAVQDLWFSYDSTNRIVDLYQVIHRTTKVPGENDLRAFFGHEDHLSAAFARGFAEAAAETWTADD
jgi:hypothetical protein